MEWNESLDFLFKEKYIQCYWSANCGHRALGCSYKNRIWRTHLWERMKKKERERFGWGVDFVFVFLFLFLFGFRWADNTVKKQKHTQQEYENLYFLINKLHLCCNVVVKPQKLALNERKKIIWFEIRKKKKKRERKERTKKRDYIHRHAMCRCVLYRIVLV